MHNPKIKIVLFSIKSKLALSLLMEEYGLRMFEKKIPRKVFIS
jgi:hypothetical protein